MEILIILLLFTQLDKGNSIYQRDLHLYMINAIINLSHL